MFRYLAPLLVFLALAGFLLAGIGRDPTELPSPLLDRPAPAFSLPRLGDPEATVRSADYADQPWLLNVWGSWCPECRVEHPLITELAQRLPVFGLNWKDDPQDAQRWLAQFGDPYHAVGFDGDGRVGIDFGVYGAPETFLIDGDGIIRFKHIGPLTPTIIRDELLPALEAIQ